MPASATSATWSSETASRRRPDRPADEPPTTFSPAISSTCSRSSTSTPSAPSTWCSMPAAASPGSWRPTCSIRLPCRTTRPVLRGGRHVSAPRGEPADRGEPARPDRARQVRRRGRRHRLGRRRGPLLLHRRRRRVRGGRLHHRSARRGVSPQAAGREDHLRRARQPRGQGHRGDLRGHRADEPRRPRVLQGRMRKEDALFGGEVTGTTTSATISSPTSALFRRCSSWS